MEFSDKPVRFTQTVAFLKIASILATLVVIGGLVYGYKYYTIVKNKQLEIENQKQTIFQELKKSQEELEIAISENSILKTDLIIERQKVTNLLEEISAINVDMSELLKYKLKIELLKKTILSLKKEKYSLKMQNQDLQIKMDNTILALTLSKKLKDSLQDITNDYSWKLKKGSAISVINLKAFTHKQSDRGSFEITDKVNKANMVKISFLVVGSKISKPCKKEYYIQIIDSKNNIIGERKSQQFGPFLLDYSFYSPVNFVNESLEVSAEFLLEKPTEGIHFVNVFDKGTLVSNTTFALR